MGCHQQLLSPPTIAIGMTSLFPELSRRKLLNASEEQNLDQLWNSSQRDEPLRPHFQLRQQPWYQEVLFVCTSYCSWNNAKHKRGVSCGGHAACLSRLGVLQHRGCGREGGEIPEMSVLTPPFSYHQGSRGDKGSDGKTVR